MACQKIDYAFNAATGIFTITGGAGGVVSFQVGANITTVMTIDGLVIMSNGVQVGTIPLAGDTTSGLVQLATSGNYPQHTNNTDAATPAYVKAAVDAAIAAAVDLRVTNVTRSGNSITVTRSDGQTWVVPDVNVQSFAFVGGVLRITETDGTTHDLTPPAGWSDVFTSYVGTTMNFADGDSVDLANLNESLVTQPDGSIRLIDGAGNVSGTVPVWTDRALPSALVANDYGLGRIIDPANNAALAASELEDTNADDAAVSADALSFVLGNSIADAGPINGVASVRNPNGTAGNLRFRNPSVTDTSPVIVFDGHGSETSISPTLASGSVLIIPDPVYVGQVAYLRGGLPTNDSAEWVIQATATARLRGNARWSVDNLGNPVEVPAVTYAAGGVASALSAFILRGQEEVTLVCIAAGQWEVISTSTYARADFSVATGSGFCEQPDGTYSLNLIASAGGVVTFPFGLAFTTYNVGRDPTGITKNLATASGFSSGENVQITGAVKA